MWSNFDLDELRSQKDDAWRKQKRLKRELDEAWGQLQALERSHGPEIVRLKGKPGYGDHRRRLVDELRRARRMHREVLAEYRTAREEFSAARNALEEGIQAARDATTARRILGIPKDPLFGSLFRWR